jgi:protein involved in sex pheromone biosynthesis
MKINRFIIYCLIGAFASTFFLSACKAKTCDAASNVTEQSKSRKRVKNIGLFSRKEMRRQRWR